MSDVAMRSCPIPGCNTRLGTTRNGNPYLLCPAHYHALPNDLRLKLWRFYGAWQRIERTFRRAQLAGVPGPLVDARAEAIRAYLDVRSDAIHAVTVANSEQLELAR